jgi:hypothetical protein
MMTNQGSKRFLAVKGFEPNLERDKIIVWGSFKLLLNIWVLISSIHRIGIIINHG